MRNAHLVTITRNVKEAYAADGVAKLPGLLIQSRKTLRPLGRRVTQLGDLQQFPLLFFEQP